MAMKKILDSNAKRIIYVSCYPETQKRDIDILVNKGDYKLERIILIDQFPHTHHMETIALLVK